MRDWMPWAKRTLVLTSTPRFTGTGRKITLHSMECGSERQPCWPSYGNGAATPHFSLSPGTGEARQHIPLSRSARALVSPGGGRSPNWNAGVNIQIEVVGWAKDVYRYGDDWYRQLAVWVDAIAREVGVPPVMPYSWPLKNGYGVNGAGRVAWDEISRVSGIVAHVNWPFNTHWDAPFDQARLKRYLSTDDTEDDMPLSDEDVDRIARAVWRQDLLDGASAGLLLRNSFRIVRRWLGPPGEAPNTTRQNEILKAIRGVDEKVGEFGADDPKG